MNIGLRESTQQGGRRRRIRPLAAAATRGGGSSTASNQGRNALRFEACHEVLAQPELLSAILEHDGKGHFCFVVSVCEEWKASYTALYPAVETAFSSVVSSVECVNWVTSQQGLELSVGLFKAAARYGDVEVCKALHGKDCPWGEEVIHATARNSKHGLSILKWLRSENLPDKEQCPWYGNGSVMCTQAATTGHLEMLKWLLSDVVGPEFKLCCWASACASGHVPVVKWLLEYPPTRAVLEENPHCEYDSWRSAAEHAALGGQVEVLQLLHTNARHLCSWDQEVCLLAVMYGEGLALKWLRSEEVQCAWDEKSCPQVIRDSVLEDQEWDIDAKVFEEIKQWVHANGHPCNCQD